MEKRLEDAADLLGIDKAALELSLLALEKASMKHGNNGGDDGDDGDDDEDDGNDASDPTKKAAPVEYVRVCNVGGITGWTLPGSDTCVKFSGYMTAHFIGGNINNAYNPASAIASSRRRVSA